MSRLVGAWQLGFGCHRRPWTSTAQVSFPSHICATGPNPNQGPRADTEVDAQGQGPESRRHPPQAQLLRSLYSQLTGGQHGPGREMARTWLGQTALRPQEGSTIRKATHPGVVPYCRDCWLRPSQPSHPARGLDRWLESQMGVA